MTTSFPTRRSSDLYETELTQKANIVALANWVNERFPLSVLINNAGCGGTQRFQDVDVDYLDRIIQLNVKATALLTHQLMPNLMKSDQAYVLNVGSVEIGRASCRERVCQYV